MMLRYYAEYDAMTLYNGDDNDDDDNCSWRPVLVQELGNFPPGRAAGLAHAEVTVHSLLEHGKSQSIPPELTRAQVLSSSCNHSSFSVCELFSCRGEREGNSRTLPRAKPVLLLSPRAAPLDA